MLRAGVKFTGKLLRAPLVQSELKRITQVLAAADLTSLLESKKRSLYYDYKNFNDATGLTTRIQRGFAGRDHSRDLGCSLLH